VNEQQVRELLRDLAGVVRRHGIKYIYIQISSEQQFLSDVTVWRSTYIASLNGRPLFGELDDTGTWEET
jgi:hypothetical protein